VWLGDNCLLVTVVKEKRKQNSFFFKNWCFWKFLLETGKKKKKKNEKCQSLSLKISSTN
jgi:hypothetical protein